MITQATETRFGEFVQIGRSQVHIGGHLELQRSEYGLRPIRLPQKYWSRFPIHSAHLRSMVTRPAGVRLSLRTAATELWIRARCTGFLVSEALMGTNAFVAQVASKDVASAVSPIDALERTTADGDDLGTENIRPSSVIRLGPLPEGDKIVEILLPQLVMVDLIDLWGDAQVRPATNDDLPLWVHHGSSISHGSEPQRPTSSWPVVTAQAAGLNLINLGFAGQCKIDPFVADAIAATPADVISLKLGINVVGARAMDQRTFLPAVHGFIDRVRRGHPETPIVLVSGILWPENDSLAGPSTREISSDGRVRFRALGSEVDVRGGRLAWSDRGTFWTTRLASDKRKERISTT